MKKMLLTGFAIIISTFTAEDCTSKTIGVVHLTNSEYIKGTIIEMTPDKPVVLETKEGKQYQFPNEFIDRVEVIEITPEEKSVALGIVHKINGETIQGAIIEMTPGELLKIETPGNGLLEFPLDTIDRVVLLELAARKRGTHDGPKKSPGLAMILSMAVGGGGQFYNGDFLKGMIILPCWLIGATCSLGLMASLIIDPDDEPDDTIVLGAAVGGSVWIYSMIDAHSTANRINRERGYSIYRIPIRNNLILSAVPVNNRNFKFEPGLSLTYRF